MTPAVARTLLERGGELLGGLVWFFTPLDWGKLHYQTPVNLYQKLDEGEIDIDYLKRVTSAASGLGVHLGTRDLAIRVEADDPRNAPRVTSWTLRGVPRDWHIEELEDLLRNAGFESVAIETKSPGKTGAVWGFRALRCDMRDLIPIAVAESDDCPAFTIEATRYKRKSPGRLTSNIATGATHSFRVWNFQEAVAKAKIKPGPSLRRSSPPKEDANMEIDADGDAVLPDVGVKRALPEDVRPGPESKITKARTFDLPAGAEIIANGGKGNCMPEAIAQCLSHASGKPRTHRQVRKAMVKWMRDMATAIEGKWDKRDVKDQPTSSTFLEYLNQLEAVGAWCGNLELYSLAKGLPLNLLVLDFDTGNHYKFPAASDSDPFCVLKLASAHYEWVKCDDPTLVHFWQGAALGSCYGGRGGGFMNLSDCASSCTKAACGPRMNLSAAASSDCPNPDGPNRRSFSGGKRTAPKMALTVAASRSSSKRAARQSSTGSTSRNRPRSASSKRARKRSGPTTSEVDTQEIEDIDGIIECFSSSAQRTRHVEAFVCPLCPFIAKKATQSATNKARYAHNRRFHPAIKPGVKFYCDFNLIVPITDPDTVLGWKCPFCNFGAPVTAWDAASRWARDNMSTAHRREHHPNITKRNWVRRLRVTQLASKRLRSRARATSFNRAVAAEGTSSLPARSCVRFLWPWMKNRKGRAAFHRAWQCCDCLLAFQLKFDFNRHVCSDPCHRKAAVRAARLAKLKELRIIYDNSPDMSKHEADVIWNNAVKAFKGISLSS